MGKDANILFTLNCNNVSAYIIPSREVLTSILAHTVFKIIACRQAQLATFPRYCEAQNRSVSKTKHVSDIGNFDHGDLFVEYLFFSYFNHE